METLMLFFLVLWHGIHWKCTASCVEDQNAFNSGNEQRIVTCHFPILDSAIYQDYIQKLSLDTMKLSISCDTNDQPSFLLNGMFSHLHHMTSLDIKDCAFSYFPRVFPKTNSLINISIEYAKNLVVGGQALVDLRQLQMLSLTNCGLTTIPSLCSLKSLRYLNVSFNELRYLDTIVDGECQNRTELTFLKTLDVRNNSIINFPETFSSFFPNLIHLDAAENNIEYLNVGSMSKFYNLQWVDLGSNKIRRLPEYLIPSPQNLNFIVLASNPLENIPTTLLNPGQVYEHLDLSYLDLNDSIWDRLVHLCLMELRLNGNNLTTIPKLFISNQPNLTHLYIAENAINYIADDTFSSSVIEYLELRNNRISNIFVDSLRGLENLLHLDLSANSIEVFEASCFSNMSLLHTLHISENQLQEVPDLTGLSSLQVLELRKNKIKKLHPGLFQGLKKILGISLAFNNISVVPLGVFQNLPKLILVNLKRNSIHFIDNGAFEGLPNLQFIQLDYNNISHISGVFSHVPVKVLWLDANNIMSIENGDLPETLTHATLAMNKIFYLDSYVFSRMTNLITVDLRYNTFHTFRTSLIFEVSPYVSATPTFYLKGNLLICDCRIKWFKLKTELTTNQQLFPDIDEVFCADKANRPISHVAAKEFVCWFENVTIFDKTYSCPTMCNCSHTQDRSTFNIFCNNRALQDIPSFPVVSSNVYLQNNNIAVVPFGSFDALSRLKVLDLSGNRINILGDKVFRHLFSLEILRLNNNQLSKISNRTFVGLEKLRQLYLQNNNILFISASIFQDLSRLSYVYLNGNNLTSLSAVSSLLKKYTALNISNNPWICNCSDMYSFQPLFLEYSQNIIDANDSSCVLDACESNCNNITSYRHSYKIIEFPLSEICDNITTIYSNSTILSVTFFEDVSRVVALSVFLFLLLIATILAVIVVRKRDLIRVYVYASFGWRIFDQRRTLDDSGKIYDAFVSYSSKDEDFIVHSLAPGLENDERAYKLCLHYRDFPVGAFIAETIVEYINQSKRTIMVLSNNYLQSEWCHLEFKTAHKQMLKDKRNRLIVILLGDISNDELDDDIKLYLETKTYLRYDDPWFWKKLFFALPDVKLKANMAEDVV